jgi:hypothetical protein
MREVMSGDVAFSRIERHDVTGANRQKLYKEDPDDRRREVLSKGVDGTFAPGERAG